MRTRSVQKLGRDAKVSVSMFNRLTNSSAERTTRGVARATRHYRAPIEAGLPVSVAWCRMHLSPLRGEGETTLLPVGMGINALRFGMSAYFRARSRGLEVGEPIGFIRSHAERVQQGRVFEPLPIGLWN